MADDRTMKTSGTIRADKTHPFSEDSSDPRYVLPRAIPGYKRVNIEFSMNEDRTEITWSVVDIPDDDHRAWKGAIDEYRATMNGIARTNSEIEAARWNRNAGFSRFTDRARKVMQLANAQAIKLNHDYLGVEHITLGLIAEGQCVACAILKSFDVKLDEVRIAIEALCRPAPPMVLMGKMPMTPRAKNVVMLANHYAELDSNHYVGTQHLLAGLVNEQDCGIRSLGGLGLTVDGVRQRVREMVASESVKSADSVHPTKSTLAHVVNIYHGMFTDMNADDLRKAAGIPKPTPEPTTDPEPTPAKPEETWRDREPLL